VTARIFAENPVDARSTRRNRRTKRWSRKSAEETLPLGDKEVAALPPDEADALPRWVETIKTDGKLLFY